MIESSGNSQIKSITKLLKSRSERRKQDSYVVEGPKMVLEAASFGMIRKVYIADSMWKALSEDDSAFLACSNRLPGHTAAEALEAVTSYEYEIVADRIFEDMSDTVTPQGILAIAPMKLYEMSGLPGIGNDCRARWLMLENVQDPGNLGTIIRTAEAAGFDAVLMNKGTVDIYNPKVVRATMGAVFRMPFVYAGDICSIINECHSNGMTVAGASLAGKDIRNVIYPSRLAIIIGNESKGMTDEAEAMCDELYKLPMYGQAESLNASVAAGVLMYLSIL